MCPQCGTRHDDWDHGGEDEEDRYVAVVQKCVGCEVIADKQAELSRDGEPPHGMKVGLVPASQQAALDLIRELQKRRTDNDD
ncbi:hypothetical protein [Streptomyces sp. NPDC007991]|uniref:hypothetical protein n=1 Tax=Streptomyces sp. NPDC007991 TaxID=3364803 RepID=UPI0036E00FB6